MSLIFIVFAAHGYDCSLWYLHSGVKPSAFTASGGYRGTCPRGDFSTTVLTRAYGECPSGFATCPSFLLWICVPTKKVTTSALFFTTAGAELLEKNRSAKPGHTVCCTLLKTAQGGLTSGTSMSCWSPLFFPPKGPLQQFSHLNWVSTRVPSSLQVVRTQAAAASLHVVS